MTIYSVPVIQQGLRHEETILQTLNSFEYLQKIITQVFDQIDARIDTNNTRISSIRSRINVANQKINSLTGTNKAITIFSPAKYPAADHSIQTPATFTQDNRNPAIQLRSEYEVQSNLDPITHKNLNEKLQVYRVRNSEAIRHNRLNAMLTPPTGLGPSSPQVQSVADLLVFNEPQSPYSAYRNADGSSKLKSQSTVISTHKSTAISQMDAPPLLISARRLAKKKLNESLFYSPELSEAPALDIPLDLPDLPGIADDVAYNVMDELDTQIAPSKGGGIFVVPDSLILPEIIESPVIENKSLSVDKVDNPPLPPPPPPPPVMPVASVPPPPPPPPVVAPPPPPVPRELMQSQPIKPPIPVSDGRSDLMAAIRKAGGKSTLKAVGGDASETTKMDDGKEEVKKPVALDHMTELHNKLMMRRKGISGNKDGETKNVMDRVSEMIPPPPKPQHNSSATDVSEDEDWDE